MKTEIVITSRNAWIGVHVLRRLLADAGTLRPDERRDIETLVMALDEADRIVIEQEYDDVHP